MNAEAIRNVVFDHVSNSDQSTKALWEIAAQLAELNASMKSLIALDTYGEGKNRFRINTDGGSAE